MLPICINSTSVKMPTTAPPLTTISRPSPSLLPSGTRTRRASGPVTVSAAFWGLWTHRAVSQHPQNSPKDKTWPAGTLLTVTIDWSCSRYDHSYPYLVNTDPRLGDSSKRKFQFNSCSGAVTKDVLDHQIPNLDSGQQAIMLSIGEQCSSARQVLEQRSS